MGLSYLLEWFEKLPILHLLDTHLEMLDEHWETHKNDRMLKSNADKSRSPQLDSHRGRDRHGSVCCSSRAINGDDNDNDNDHNNNEADVKLQTALKVAPSFATTESDDDVDMPGTPGLKPVAGMPEPREHSSFIFNQQAREVYHHGHTYHVQALDLSDSREVWQSGSPSDSLMFEATEDEPALFDMHFTQDYLLDQKTDIKTYYPIFINSPLLLTEEVLHYTA